MSLRKSLVLMEKWPLGLKMQQIRVPLALTHRVLGRAWVEHVHRVSDRVGGGCVVESVVDGVLLEGHVSGGEGVEESDVEESDETRYKINESAFRSLLHGDGDSESCSAVGVTSGLHALNAGDGSAGSLGNSGNRVCSPNRNVRLAVACSDPVNNKVTIASLFNNKEEDNNHNQGHDNCDREDTSEEDDSAKIAATKEVWGKGRILFDSSDEEEVIARLSHRKIARKKRFKKHRQTRIASCIQRRTLATRILRSESKSKSK
ncbi:hypothetical protein PIB30_101171 [Stylosanthes scabra]|uniref:Uncharacterized protein n=1 Tax=Stylosanthes scabra TaxID=79078 RepID=A0ABU6RXB6_9FABA|nr:hypothetical protein [Stylosanthes scabra]